MMNRIALPRPLRGIIVPIITPFDDTDKLDAGALEQLVEHIIEGGAHGLFVLGTTGEAASLPYAIRHDLVSRVCVLADGRIPVLVGITDTSMAESLRLAGTAARAGAQGVVAAPPYYFPLEQIDLLHYMEKLSEELPLPLMIYNMPSCTHFSFSLESVMKCSEISNIVGFKDSSGDLGFFKQVHDALSDRPDFSILLGQDELLGEAVPMGAHGGVNGGANFAPRLFSRLYDAACQGDAVEVARLKPLTERIVQIIYDGAPSPSRVILGIKAALKALGIGNGRMIEPYADAQIELPRVQEVLDEVNATVED